MDWLVKVRNELTPWADGSRREITLHTAQHILGELQHASRVVTLGRGYFAEMQALANRAGVNAHPGTVLKLSHGARHIMQMWSVLLENMSLTSAIHLRLMLTTDLSARRILRRFLRHKRWVVLGHHGHHPVRWLACGLGTSHWAGL